jgi:hypothetical protein
MYENGWLAWIVALGLVAFSLAHNHPQKPDTNVTIKEKTYGKGEWR